MPQSKQLIIIPGSCSAKSNWFDQIDFFESIGYQVKFLDLDAHKHATLIECSTNLFIKLKYALQSSLESETVILAHSMGAMLLLKILSEAKYYRNESQETFDAIEQAKLVFIQVPLNVNRSLLLVLNIVQYLLYPFFLIYHLSIFRLVEWLLLSSKKLLRIIMQPLMKLGFLQYIAQPIFRLMDLFLNVMLMSNAFLGTKPQEFANLINYYKQWDEFSLEGFFANKEEAMFSRAMMQRAENTLNRFDTKAAKNYHFTVGSPDFFCDSILIKQFATELGANVLHLEYGFHNPQHIFWAQEKLHKEITR